MGACPTAESRRAAGFVHHAHECAEQHEEDENTDVVGICKACNEAVFNNVYERALKGEFGIEKTACQNADEEGGIHLFGDEGENDGDDRRQNCPNRRIERRYIGADLRDGFFSVDRNVFVGSDNRVIVVDIVLRESEELFAFGKVAVKLRIEVFDGVRSIAGKESVGGRCRVGSFIDSRCCVGGFAGAFRVRKDAENIDCAHDA